MKVINYTRKRGVQLWWKLFGASSAEGTIDAGYSQEWCHSHDGIGIMKLAKYIAPPRARHR
jgi:hypothetical protein